MSFYVAVISPFIAEARQKQMHQNNGHRRHVKPSLVPPPSLPPTETPPIEIETPPTETPPTETPPIETPPTETPPTETPPTETPPTETPPTQTPPTETPPIETPPTETPRTETPATGTPWAPPNPYDIGVPAALPPTGYVIPPYKPHGCHYPCMDSNDCDGPCTVCCWNNTCCYDWPEDPPSYVSLSPNSNIRFL